jgi:hypothetical protein
MATIRKDKETAIQYMRATRRPLETRIPTGPLDYGDVPTVGLQVKRVNLDIGDIDADDAFGVYLGQHPDGFVILIWDIFYQPTSAEVFQTIEDVKREWRLD